MEKVEMTVVEMADTIIEENSPTDYKWLNHCENNKNNINKEKRTLSAFAIFKKAVEEEFNVSPYTAGRVASLIKVKLGL